MAEYIEREAAVKAFNNFDAGRADSPPSTLLTPEEFAEYLYELPAADVAPVVHGRFVHDGPRFAGGVDWWHCSSCGRLASGIEMRFDYCPHCGARMDSEETDNG